MFNKLFFFFLKKNHFKWTILKELKLLWLYFWNGNKKEKIEKKKKEKKKD
jgi:hypothetical protein